MNNKPQCVILEEAVREIFRKQREKVNAWFERPLQPYPNVRDIYGLEEEIVAIFSTNCAKSVDEEKAQFNDLKRRILDILDKRWRPGSVILVALDQIDSNLVAIFNEFRPRMM